MEIAPIAAIRAVPAVKARAIDAELSTLFDIEPSARAGDDTYTRNGKKAAGAEENDDQEEAEALEEFSGSAPSTDRHSDNAKGQISFFA